MHQSHWPSRGFITLTSLIFSAIIFTGTSQARSFNSFTDFVYIYPEAPRLFKMVHFEYSPVEKLQEQVLHHVNYYASFDHVPYVWGGGSLGLQKPSACDRCKACIETGIPLKKQFTRCKSCQQCGIDCSHLTAQLYNRVGLEVPYGSTKELNRMTRRKLKRLYSLVDIGKDLRFADTGDLILYDRHIVLLVENLGNGEGYILHSENQDYKGLIGGIIFEKRERLWRLGTQNIRKILRHERFFDYSPPETYAMPSYVLKRQEYLASTEDQTDSSSTP